MKVVPLFATDELAPVHALYAAEPEVKSEVLMHESVAPESAKKTPVVAAVISVQVLVADSYSSFVTVSIYGKFELSAVVARSVYLTYELVTATPVPPIVYETFACELTKVNVVESALL